MKKRLSYAQRILEDLQEMWQEILVVPGTDGVEIHVDNHGINTNLDYPMSNMSYDDFHDVIPATDELDTHFAAAMTTKQPVKMKLPDFIIKSLLRKSVPQPDGPVQPAHGQEYHNSLERGYTAEVTHRV